MADKGKTKNEKSKKIPIEVYAEVTPNPSVLKFVSNKKLVENDYTHLCVVPCSFAKYFINEVINNPKIEYLPAASEAVACSVAAGLKTLELIQAEYFFEKLTNWVS